jgi:hypothetical protein
VNKAIDGGIVNSDRRAHTLRHARLNSNRSDPLDFIQPVYFLSQPQTDYLDEEIYLLPRKEEKVQRDQNIWGKVTNIIKNRQYFRIFFICEDII